MPSQFQIEDETWGVIKVFAIHQKEDGTWESEWEPLRQAEGVEHILDLIEPLSYDVYQELRHKHIQPYLENQGLPPEACLIKLDENSSLCHYRDTCPSYDKDMCRAENESPPPCYAAGAPVLEKDHDAGTSGATRTLVTRLFDLWRFGFHVILAQPENYDQ